MAMPRSYDDWADVLKRTEADGLEELFMRPNRIIEAAFRASAQAAMETFAFGDCKIEIVEDRTMPESTIRIQSGRDYVDIVNIEPEKPSFDRPGA